MCPLHFLIINAWSFLGMEGRQLLMKAIIHMFNLDALYETFPDACYIVMFRPIKNIVASFLSLMRMATAQFRVEHDEKWMNRNIRILRTLVEKGIRWVLMHKTNAK